MANRTEKIGISLPGEDIKKLLSLQRKLKLSRSGVIRRAVDCLSHIQENEEKSLRYELGYRRYPPATGEGEAMIQVSAETLPPEEWP